MMFINKRFERLARSGNSLESDTVWRRLWGPVFGLQKLKWGVGTVETPCRHRRFERQSPQMGLARFGWVWLYFPHEEEIAF